ncbi:MAG: aminomethyl-transferring glycine dehydrogenase [Aeromicrobium sp.]|uniref:aminomethyl-transferring glycine dehydrogenase n=1 Tax=Aeromicrobium sp. TaxID=1871063 RepID=UPI0039E5D134
MTLFVDRHIGPRAAEIEHMVREVGFDSLDALVDTAVPSGIRTEAPSQIAGRGMTEQAVLARLRELAERNNPGAAMIGAGYHPTVTPPVIRRGVLESPAWYTAYTPYQPEISQGRLEALLNFQTMVGDLTGLPTANSSLLDEATAAAEAMTLVRRAVRGRGDAPVVVDSALHPQTLAVVRTRAEAMGIELIEADLADGGLPTDDCAGALLAYPRSDGGIVDPRPLIEATHAANGLAVVVADPMALVLIASPGSMGADVVVGSAQRFGVPMFYGGPHAGFMAVRDGLERHLPGRLVGVSVDADGRPAYRLALQTREQHIRREKATSNICTAQVLLAVVASMYAVYHGPDGLGQIAARIHGHAAGIAGCLREGGVELVADHFFDTVTARVPGRAAEIVGRARESGVHLRLVDADHVGVSCSEATTGEHVVAVLAAFGVDPMKGGGGSALPPGLLRTDPILTHPVFHEHRSETRMLRYLTRLSQRDYALDRGMIPLGSCTMKLNATAEMEPISYPGFADLHPFVPAEDAAGFIELIDELESWLADLTGYAKVSIQPNAGSQGELAGLLAIRAYHRSRGDEGRTVCLIPSSAHGTNAASAVMAGMKVVVVRSTDEGEVDLDHLRELCATHADDLAAVMVTYPSTHGVYEHGITELCEVVHAHGGQVYVDGANLNALVGHARPGEFGGDVSHLNLHKTFCVPHGGGGPGVGPVAVAAHLAEFLPTHPHHPDPARREGVVGPVSAAPFGSAGILPIPYAYIALMGADGLRKATSVAVLAANYIAERLGEAYPVLYAGADGLVAHECVLDLRDLTKAAGLTVDDVAKRLVDYGFHAPTMSFPVAGTFMVEPTESEDLAELDRFCDAMLAIREEIDQVTAGEFVEGDNPLVNAPHTAHDLLEWDHAYEVAEGVFPSGSTVDKYWPPVARVDQAYGDRNLSCSCPPPEAFAE